MINTRFVFVATIIVWFSTSSLATAASITFTDVDGVLNLTSPDNRVKNMTCFTSLPLCRADLLAPAGGVTPAPLNQTLWIAESDSDRVSYRISYGYFSQGEFARVEFARDGVTWCTEVGGCDLRETGALQPVMTIYWASQFVNVFDTISIQGDLPNSASTTVAEPATGSFLLVGLTALNALRRKRTPRRVT
jgi:hypothetical protein